MSQYCLIGSAVLCYVTVAVTTTGCAVAYLVGRFKSGNSIHSILLGGPQYVFYTINIGAGLFTLFASEALGSSHITEKVVSDLSLAIVQSSALAFATFIGLRTTVKNGENIEIGPGRLFAVLLDNIERRIDQNRTVKATEDIMGLSSKLPTPRAVLNVVLPYCFDQAEKDSGNRTEITKTLEAIVTDNDRNTLSRERAILMLSHLHKSFGIEVVISAIKLVDDANIIALDKNAAGSPLVGTEALNAIQSSDTELDSILQQFRELQQSRRS